MTKNESTSVEITNIAGYAVVEYNEEWWLALVVELSTTSNDVKVNFLHPKGPSSSYFFPEFEDSCWLDAADVILKWNLQLQLAEHIT